MRSRLQQAGAAAASTAKALSGGLAQAAERLKAEAGRIIDTDRWRRSLNWSDRLASVSWPRLSVAVGASAAIGVGLWALVQPDGIRSHPPRLPTEQEWRATQAAAAAMEADLSPALAAANRSVAPGGSR